MNPAATPLLNAAPRRSSASATPPAVSIETLSVHYGHTAALCSVSLQAPAGQLTALVGPSGCGKSSLLYAVNRMTDSVADCSVDGQIRIGELAVRDPSLSTSALRRRVGMVFQQANPFPLSIADNILFPLRDHGLRDRAELHARLQDVLEQTGLWDEVKDRLQHSALTLSGGQQQRLCLARALALRPQVLLLDEPCSALDPISTERIEQLLLSLKGSITMLMVTHNLGQARRVADQLAVCWVDAGCGCIVESGRAEDLFSNPVHPVTRDYCQGRVG